MIDSQSGNHVSGRYGTDGNSLVNTIKGDFLTGDQCNVLSGTFENTVYNTTGTFKYTFSGDGTGFSGSWEDNKGFTGSWSGTREAQVQEEHCPLAASLKNCKQPLELRPGAPSEVCEICISGWCRNTANPVRVILPQQSDWWGTNAPGIVVFAGGKEEPPDAPLPEIISPMTVEPSNMSGYRCWDSPFETYPWNLFVRARATAPAGPVAIPIEVRQRIPGTDRDAVVNLNMQVRVLPGGRVVLPGGGGQTVPLKLFWSAARGDNFTTATPEGESAALSAGYTFVRIEGYVYPTQQPGTVPLKLYYSNARGDNYTTGVAQGEQAAQAAGYGYARVEGYIYPTQQPGTVPLKNYWNSSREDNFSTATSDGERDALGSGYQFAWVEGYVLPNDK